MQTSLRVIAIATLLAAAVVADSRLEAPASNWVVIDTHGGVIDVDPAPYTPEARRQRKLQVEIERQRQLDLAKARAAAAARLTSSPPQVDGGWFFDDDESDDNDSIHEDIAVQKYIPDIETLSMPSESAIVAEWIDEDIDASEINTQMIGGSRRGVGPTSNQSWSVSSVLDELNRMLEDDSGFPAIQGSVTFAELSCIFVAFIGYLVFCMPLWSSFTRGHKCCLITSFGAAILYQFVVIGWFWGAVALEMMLWSSSLITRMTSLGMVPLTTRSFLGRARMAAAVANQALEEKSAAKSSGHSHSRHRHSRARCS